MHSLEFSSLEALVHKLILADITLLHYTTQTLYLVQLQGNIPAQMHAT